MKSIKEKQLLVKWSKAMNEPIDPALVEEVERYEQLQKDIIESVRSNSIKDLQEASVVAEKFVEKINIDYPKPPTLDEVLQIIQEETKEIVETVPEVKEEPAPISLADKVAEHITKEVKLEQASFQQPNPPLVDKNLQAIQTKLKFLEQAIGKIAAHGPGSGEVRFLRLDDVNYQSWQDRDRHKILKYEPNTNPAYDGVTFGFLTGDQGEVYSLKYDTVGYTSNANVAAGLTAWNSSRDCLDIHQADNTICQVGLENYIRVYNDTPNTIPNGTFTVFTGVKDSNLEAPTIGGFLANTTAIPLYSVGVTTNDISSNSLGRVTVLGEVKNLNASGSNAGNSQPEIWNVGDILWASPSHAGKLTKYQPSAPNVAVSVAAVVDNGSTDGILLVRPTIFPRLYYGEFYSTQDQIAPNTNFGHYVTFNSTTLSSGFTKNAGNTIITAQHTGLYKVQCKAQITSTNASKQEFYMWGVKNGIDIPNSTIQVSSQGNGSANAPIWQRTIQLNAGESFSIKWATTSTDVFIDASPLAFGPARSGVSLTVFQIDL